MQIGNIAVIIRMQVSLALEAEILEIRDSIYCVQACLVPLSYQVFACTNLPTLHENRPPSFFQNSWLLS